MEPDLVRVSKFLSFVLRHRPDEIGLVLDPQGWVSVEELIDRAGRHGTKLSRAVIEQVVATNDKKRFAFSEDGTRIRASQGHSVDVDLALEPREPPDILLHGTATRFLVSIREKGLIPGTRQHVHLTTDEKGALKSGQRYGKPVALPVRAGDMHRAGLVFYCSANGVWLTEHVPAEFIQFP